MNGRSLCGKQEEQELLILWEWLWPAWYYCNLKEDFCDKNVKIHLLEAVEEKHSGKRSGEEVVRGNNQFQPTYSYVVNVFSVM